LSKGGLLYHFKSKEDMMVGLIHRQIAGMNQELKDQVFNDPEPRGRFARAYLNVAYQKDECENPSQKLCSTLIAVIANNPKLLEPILTQINSIQERLQNDGLDPTSAFIIRLIGDGIWFNQMLGIPVDPDMIANVLQRVQEETGSCL
jgi:AcrR family transcriptional regulator